MQKFDGKICDVCRTMFYPGDHIVELCEECANNVWCVFNIYESGKEELASIHRTEEKANIWAKSSKKLLARFKDDFPDKIVDQKVVNWYIL